MDVNGMCCTDEFRMRSPVVGFCFVIVVLCALSVESARSYPTVHGAGPIIRSAVPTIGHTIVEVGPQSVGRRQQRQLTLINPNNPVSLNNINQDYYDELDEFIDEDEDEDEDTDYGGGYGGGNGGGHGGNEDYEDEDDEDDEESDSDTDNEEFGVNNVAVDNIVLGRHAFINNEYIEDPDVQRQRPQYNRLPVRSSTETPIKTAMPESVITISPLPVLQPSGDQYQKLQLRPVAMSTQFIATPVADLILRLSISLAKPIGQGNGTSFNVPIRVHQVKGAEDSKAIGAELELSRTDKVPVVTPPSADRDLFAADAYAHETDEKEKTA